jgi:hypothetical protein
LRAFSLCHCERSAAISFPSLRLLRLIKVSLAKTEGGVSASPSAHSLNTLNVIE